MKATKIRVPPSNDDDDDDDTCDTDDARKITERKTMMTMTTTMAWIRCFDESLITARGTWVMSWTSQLRGVNEMRTSVATLVTW